MGLIRFDMKTKYWSNWNGTSFYTLKLQTISMFNILLFLDNQLICLIIICMLLNVSVIGLYPGYFGRDLSAVKDGTTKFKGANNLTTRLIIHFTNLVLLNL